MVANGRGGVGFPVVRNDDPRDGFFISVQSVTRFENLLLPGTCTWYQYAYVAGTR